MPEIVCPKGHESSETDFCSVCGAKMAEPAAPHNACPDCGLAHDATGNVFCEFCGFNFQTGAHGALKEPAVAPAVAVTPDVAVTPVPVAVAPEWTVVVEVDASMKNDESPDPPAGVAPVTISLSAASSLIGRRSEKRAIFPEIALDADDAVSHRHALFNRNADGGLTLRDIGSSNGTNLNGAPVTPLTDIAVKSGDVITLGHWTRIRIQ